MQGNSPAGLRKISHFAPRQIELLAENNPKREPGDYIASVDNLAAAQWNEETRKLLKKWFAAESHPVARKEAMLLLLKIIEPQPLKPTETSPPPESSR